MSSTNKTAHYSLSQYVANDKPTYLSDYNGDMAKIDAAIYAAKSAADTAETTASGLAPTVTENETNIGELQTDMTLVKTTQATQGNAIESLQEFMEQVISQNYKQGKLNISNHSGNASTITSQDVYYRQYELANLKITSIYGEMTITPKDSSAPANAMTFDCNQLSSIFGNPSQSRIIRTVANSGVEVHESSSVNYYNITSRLVVTNSSAYFEPEIVPLPSGTSLTSAPVKMVFQVCVLG